MYSTRRAALAGLMGALGGGLGFPFLARAAGPAAAAPAEAEVPFELAYNQAYTAVKLDGHGWYRFILDTGADFFSLDDKIAREIGLQRRSSALVSGVVGHQYLSSYVAHDVNIANRVHDAEVGVLGMNVRDEDLQGLIPAARLGGAVFDFDQKRLRLSHKLPDRMDGFEAVDRLKAGGDEVRPLIKAKLDGKPIRLLIDTGAQSGIVLFPDYVRRYGLWDKYKDAQQGAMIGVTGGGRTRTSRAETFEMGSVKFDKPYLTLSNPEDVNRNGGVGFDPTEDGLIGMELLRRLDLGIDPFASHILIRANRRFADVERVDRSGLTVRMRGGKPTAVTVREGGPAWRAGIREGDLIVGYAGGSTVADLNWKLSGPAGDEVVMLVDHAGAQKQIALKLEDPH